jgi:acyl carrier protein
MEKKEIEQKVIEIVAVQFSVELDTKFITDLAADSLDTVEIIMMTEDMFNITMPDEDAEKLMNVGMVVDYVEKTLADDSSK